MGIADFAGAVGGRIINAGARLGPALPVVGGVIKQILPTIEDEVRVEVHMMPGGVRKDAYYLATSLAFAFVRNRTVAGLFPPAGAIYVEYDAASNVVVFVARFRSTTLEAVVDKIVQDQFQGGAQDALLDELVVISGPKTREFRGSDWQYKAKIVPGIPDAKRAPALPWANKAILTTEKMYQSPSGAVIEAKNPSPPGDSVSKSVVGYTTNADSFPNQDFDIEELAYAALRPVCQADPVDVEIGGNPNPFAGPGQ